MNHLQVVAGILIDDNHRVLIAERLGGGPFHGMWEFPGGKIAAGESAESALSRELQEELGVSSGRLESFMRLQHQYADRSVDLQFFKVHEWRGQPQGAEGQQLRWIAPGDIDEGLMLPADKPVIEALR